MGRHDSRSADIHIQDLSVPADMGRQDLGRQPEVTQQSHVPRSKSTSRSKNTNKSTDGGRSSMFKSGDTGKTGERKKSGQETRKLPSMDWNTSAIHGSALESKVGASGFLDSTSSSSTSNLGLSVDKQPNPALPPYSSTLSNSMHNPYLPGGSGGYSMPPVYPGHIGHTPGYGMGHHGLSSWYSGLSPWSTPPSYPGMPSSDPYGKHMSGSASSTYPGMGGYGGPLADLTGSAKEKETSKDKLTTSDTQRSGKDSFDMGSSAFDMQSNPLTAMSAMSGMGGIGSSESSGMNMPYHQGAHSMQAGGVAGYPYSPYHMSPHLPHMYGSSGSSYNYMSPYSAMSNPMMQHLPGSMPLHPLSDMDPTSRPPHMG